MYGRAARQEADALADSLLGLGGRPPSQRRRPCGGSRVTPLATAFAVQLIQRLRDQDPVVMPALLAGRTSDGAGDDGR